MTPTRNYDNRCSADKTYHDRIRSDGALFDAEAIMLGRQESPGLILALGLCPGCGTTISKVIEDRPIIFTAIQTDADGTERIVGTSYNRSQLHLELVDEILVNFLTASTNDQQKQNIDTLYNAGLSSRDAIDRVMGPAFHELTTTHVREVMKTIRIEQD